jgi:DNA replication protein DnaC
LDVTHDCWDGYHRALRAFEACIPRDFWGYTADDVVANVEQFKQVVLPYMDRLSRALRGGYGLLLLGDNGVGKTMFMCMVLMRAISRGFSTYYTTLLDLDYNVKRGFNKPELQDRLEWYLTSDFVALDELGKEQFKKGDSFIRTQVERMLKRRFEDSRPTLIATNASMDELESIYGVTLTSILVGKYAAVQMDPGDYREQMAARMRREMGS